MLNNYETYLHGNISKFVTGFLGKHKSVKTEFNDFLTNITLLGKYIDDFNTENTKLNTELKKNYLLYNYIYKHYARKYNTPITKTQHEELKAAKKKLNTTREVVKSFLSEFFGSIKKETLQKYLDVTVKYMKEDKEFNDNDFNIFIKNSTKSIENIFKTIIPNFDAINDWLAVLIDIVLMNLPIYIPSGMSVISLLDIIIKKNLRAHSGSIIVIDKLTEYINSFFTYKGKEIEKKMTYVAFIDYVNEYKHNVEVYAEKLANKVYDEEIIQSEDEENLGDVVDIPKMDNTFSWEYENKDLIQISNTEKALKIISTSLEKLVQFFDKFIGNTALDEIDENEEEFDVDSGDEGYVDKTYKKKTKTRKRLTIESEVQNKAMDIDKKYKIVFETYMSGKKYTYPSAEIVTKFVSLFDKNDGVMVMKLFDNTKLWSSFMCEYFLPKMLISDFHTMLKLLVEQNICGDDGILGRILEKGSTYTFGKQEITINQTTMNDLDKIYQNPKIGINDEFILDLLGNYDYVWDNFRNYSKVEAEESPKVPKEKKESKKTTEPSQKFLTTTLGSDEDDSDFEEEIDEEEIDEEIHPEFIDEEKSEVEKENVIEGKERIKKTLQSKEVEPTGVKKGEKNISPTPQTKKTTKPLTEDEKKLRQKPFKKRPIRNPPIEEKQSKPSLEPKKIVKETEIQKYINFYRNFIHLPQFIEFKGDFLSTSSETHIPQNIKFTLLWSSFMNSFVLPNSYVFKNETKMNLFSLLELLKKNDIYDNTSLINDMVKMASSGIDINSKTLVKLWELQTNYNTGLYVFFKLDDKTFIEQIIACYDVIRNLFEKHIVDYYHMYESQKQEDISEYDKMHDEYILFFQKFVDPTLFQSFILSLSSKDFNAINNYNTRLFNISVIGDYISSVNILRYDLIGQWSQVFLIYILPRMCIPESSFSFSFYTLLLLLTQYTTISCSELIELIPKRKIIVIEGIDRVLIELNIQYLINNDTILSINGDDKEFILKVKECYNEIYQFFDILSKIGD